LFCLYSLSRCLFCGSESDQTDAVRLALLSAVVAMLVLSIGVAVLSAKALALTVTAFLVLQQLAIAGVDGSKNMPVYQQQFATAFVWLNMVNFDIEVRHDFHVETTCLAEPALR
jgi:hypothetical protein